MISFFQFYGCLEGESVFVHLLLLQETLRSDQDQTGLDDQGETGLDGQDKVGLHGEDEVGLHGEDETGLHGQRVQTPHVEWRVVGTYLQSQILHSASIWTSATLSRGSADGDRGSETSGVFSC